MGVDYYSCNNCEETFPDCGDYERCDGCGRTWCDTGCGEVDGLKPKLCEPCKDDDSDDNCECEGSICGFCREEMVEDYELLEYALEKLGRSREGLAKEYLTN